MDRVGLALAAVALCLSEPRLQIAVEAGLRQRRSTGALRCDPVPEVDPGNMRLVRRLTLDLADDDSGPAAARVMRKVAELEPPLDLAAAEPHHGAVILTSWFVNGIQPSDRQGRG